MSGLQEPLIRRPDLPPQLANNMCEWVSDALKTYIKTNYNIDAKNVEASLSKATMVLRSEPPGPKDPPADSAQKLIEKMAASGQLKAGFLMRVLSQGQLDLFDLAFARLLDVDLNRFRPAFYEGGTRAERQPDRRRTADRRCDLLRLHPPERAGRVAHRASAVIEAFPAPAQRMGWCARLAP